MCLYRGTEMAGKRKFSWPGRGDNEVGLCGRSGCASFAWLVRLGLGMEIYINGRKVGEYVDDGSEYVIDY